ncbi:MAG: TlpA family protein disulfide reductase [Clostridia bacterium]|nr:TlpA family protein disulfide reductase [Clostridia bacterium]
MKKAICLLMALSLLCACAHALAGAETAALGKPFQDFTVTTIDGEEFTLSKALAQYEAVYINLFATWCPPCAYEFPAMQEVYEEYRDRVAVIAISVEETDSVKKLADYRASKGLTLPMASAGSDWIIRYTQLEAIPMSLLVDRSGTLVFQHVGMISDPADFRSMFDAALPAAAGD